MKNSSSYISTNELKREIIPVSDFETSLIKLLRGCSSMSQDTTKINKKTQVLQQDALRLCQTYF